MYFSDADQDISRYSKMNERTVQSEIRNQLDVKIYHQLLSHFNAISLLRASTLGSEEDLKKIYAATRYISYSRNDQQEYHAQKSSAFTKTLQSVGEKFKRKSKEQLFWTSDSAVMLGAIENKELFVELKNKYHEQFIIFITQFEINTSNKNTIEWSKQVYTREYTIHYNVFDAKGNLLRAETITIKADNENQLTGIASKHLATLASHLKNILRSISNQQN
jgi:hypothetical protein